MGRVRRYKKLKAVDPFAKKKKAEIDTIHDEPPSFHQNRVNTAMKQMKKYETNIMAQYRKAAKEIEVVASSHGTSKKSSTKSQQAEGGSAKSGTLEGKREDESMKAFKIRIRQETRKTLHDELKGLTSTAQKRKSRLKERKKRKKAGKGGGELAGDSYFQQRDEERFGSSEIGAVRNSDRQDGIDAFPTNDTVRFGERVEAPPDLRHTFSMAGAKKAGLGVVKKKRPAEDTDDGVGGDGPSTAGMRFVQQQNKRARAAAEAGRQEGIVHAGSGSRASEADIVLARQQAVQAYKALQKKRRAADGPNFSSI